MEAIADANSNLETKTERKTTGFKSAGECMRDQVATIESGQFGICLRLTVTSDLKLLQVIVYVGATYSTDDSIYSFHAVKRHVRKKLVHAMFPNCN